MPHYRAFLNVKSHSQTISVPVKSPPVPTLPPSRDFSSSFILRIVAELSSNKRSGNGVHDETESEKFTVMCALFPQNLEFGHFTLLFGRVLRRNVTKFKLHV